MSIIRKNYCESIERRHPFIDFVIAKEESIKAKVFFYFENM